MIGSIISAIAIIAITPHEFFINDRDEDTVLNASLTDAPTNGTKLLIANRAVFNVRVSAPCDSTFLNEKINIKIDIVKTVTEVNVVLTSFEIPPNSMPPMALTQPNIRQRLTRGSIKVIKKFSTKEINKTIEAFEIVAEVIFPLKICKPTIIGAKALITLQIIHK